MRGGRPHSNKAIMETKEEAIMEAGIIIMAVIIIALRIRVREEEGMERVVEAPHRWTIMACLMTIMMTRRRTIRRITTLVVVVVRVEGVVVVVLPIAACSTGSARRHHSRRHRRSHAVTYGTRSPRRRNAPNHPHTPCPPIRS